MARPSRAIINLRALRHNYQLAQTLSGAGKAMPVVKANAYGHGILHVAKALQDQAPALGVACIEEAIELRDAGVVIPILLLEGFFSKEELALAADLDFWLMIQSDWQLHAVCNTRCSKPLVAWLKIDTGMHRLGFQPAQASACYQQLQSSPQVADEIVLATHFASADDLGGDSTRAQIDLFQRCTRGIAAPRSLSNSPALLAWPQARAEWNRPGLMLYGNSPFTEPHPEASKLQPVMSFCSRVMAIRDVPAGESVGYGGAWTAQRPSRIATIPVGYGDGYPRHAENNTPVLINGQRAGLAGRVSMDMITVDVTDLEATNIGDEVVLWGEEPSANEVAMHADTIGYEIVTRMPERVPRIVSEDGGVT
jgi:alanine racemase